jgi:aspartate carbamoyltransferase regulatory subunit
LEKPLAKRKRDITIEDVKEGDVIEFYDAGFRFAVVTKIQKKTSRKTKKVSHIIHTDRYGKVDFTKVKEIYTQTEEGTHIKPLLSDLFV